MRRSTEDYYEAHLHAREAEPAFDYYDEYQPYRRSTDDTAFQNELFYARSAEALPEPILGLNHVGKWTGQAAGSVVRGYKSRSGGGGGKHASSYGGYSKYERRDAEEDTLYDDELYVREAEAEAMAEAMALADAEAEPIFGLNTIGKWVGQAAGSVAGGFRGKAGKSKEGKKDKAGKAGKAGKNSGGGDLMGGGGGAGGYDGGYASQGSLI